MIAHSIIKHSTSSNSCSGFSILIAWRRDKNHFRSRPVSGSFFAYSLIRFTALDKNGNFSDSEITTPAPAQHTKNSISRKTLAEECPRTDLMKSLVRASISISSLNIIKRSFLKNSSACGQKSPRIIPASPNSSSASKNLEPLNLASSMIFLKKTGSSTETSHPFRSVFFANPARRLKYITGSVFFAASINLLMSLSAYEKPPALA